MKYDKLISNQVVEYKKKIAQVKNCNEDLKTVREIMGEKATIWLDYEININWSATSMAEVKEILRTFAKKGIMLDHFSESETSPSWKLKGKSASIRLSPYWTQDVGASCRLVQVGEETYTRPILKLQCDPIDPMSDPVL